MPGPQDIVAGILDGNDGITLSDGILVHRERYIAVARIVVFYIGNQIRCVLPYQFCFSRRAVSVVAYIGVSDRVTSMVDEMTQNSGSVRIVLDGAVEVYADVLVVPPLMAFPYTRGKE